MKVREIQDITEHVLSLFPGIGMLDYAFHLEGMETYRGPDVIWGGDIRNFHPGRGMFSGIIGGPPCQSFSSLVHLVRANGNEPKFGNLIPEFERCIGECEPEWFLMENVPKAPEPVVSGYGVTPFMLDNSLLDSGNGWGNEQIRKRKFCFGMRGVEKPPNLMRWINLAVFVLPDADKSNEDVPVKIGGSGKVKRTRHEAVTGGHDKPPSKRIGNGKKTYRQRTVTSNVGGFTDGSPNPNKTREETSDGGASVRMRRYTIVDALRLQGLPNNFLEHCPFTKEGALKAIANGVPIMMGRAVAKAIKECLRHMRS